jgi:hypothetical protein
MEASGRDQVRFQPDQQRVILVASRTPFETSDLLEAAEVVFSGIAGVGAEELLTEAVRAVEPASFHYEERRSRTEWGASGPEIQEIIINFASDVAAGVTIAVLLDRLKTIRDRRERDGRAQGRTEIKGVRAADDAEIAWRYFSEHLQKAFKVSQPRALEVRQTNDGWDLRAEADGGYAFVGTVDLDGRIRYSRRVDGGLTGG